MAVDYGTKRVGIALTDSLKITAQPYKTLAAKRNDQLIAAITHIVREEDVEKIIVGLPLHMDGSVSPSADKARIFAEKLSRACSIPVFMWDERLTTVEAERILREKLALSSRKIKHIRDKLAAALLLESYLEKNRP